MFTLFEVRSFVCLFVCSFVHMYVPPSSLFVCLFVRFSVRSYLRPPFKFVRLYVCSFVRSFVCTSPIKIGWFWYSGILRVLESGILRNWGLRKWDFESGILRKWDLGKDMLGKGDFGKVGF